MTPGAAGVVTALHVVNDLAPGGSERQLLQLIERSRHRHEVIQLAKLGGPSTRVLAGLRRELAAIRPDVVAAWLERPQLATAVAAARYPRVACVRGHPRARPPAERWPFRWALSRYDLLITNSERLRDAVSAFVRPLPLRPFHVVPNGVELPARPALRSGANDRLRIGFIGRGTFDPDKGLDVLLAALSAVGNGPVSATLVGKGVPESVGATGLTRDIVSAFPASEDPWSALGAVDALVVPSRTEGSPNVVLEAFVRGVPVIATAVGGTVELVDPGRGLLVPPEDPAALAAAIGAVAADPEGASRRAERGRAYALAAHAWPRVTAAYDDLLARLGSAGEGVRARRR